MRELSELVEAAQAGDSAAYECLIQRFQAMASTIAARYLGDYHLIQDVVQEAALEAFLHLQELKEPAAFPGWFRQIVFRQCTRALRQAYVPCLSLEAESLDLFAESTPEEIALRKEVQAGVRSAVASLPKPERLVTILFYGCGYSYREVDAFLKIGLPAVRRRLHSARQKLKVQLREAGERARRASDAMEGAEIILAIWWIWLLRWLEARTGVWQTRSNASCKRA
jgi:RNA polymerase sigma factor (sigma-70 family)